ncbi:MAG: XrtA system polysaccharide chain length determinant [Lamprobacter sp.]|uniref:XrtA system polysaccharide chain length determinant n=1 Tax=Lamprobacter sp. TaxID=3100796 RepID=UPI002B2566FE|nr:XrtA system polysaccharide chain length determinant [Lamprobacter sp.]MEA3641366.1 XrtA system polysaccharide chain length determinant [Lamprobacter sp.]
MREILNQVLGYLRGIWRFRWLVLAIAWVVSLGGWAYVAEIPNEYRASARVYVDTRSVLEPLLRGLAVGSDINQRLNLMTRLLLTRPNLEKVARATDMHLQAGTDAQMEGIIGRLRSGTQIGSARGENLYTLSYNSRNPQEAYAVVQAMLDLFVEGSLSDTRTDSEMARRFIDEQIEAYEQRLEQAEQRLADFRRDNVGMLPSDRGDYYQRLQSAQTELASTELQLREAERRRDEIQRQISGEEPTFGIMGPMSPSSGRRSVNPELEARIQGLRERLDELSLTYTDKHPDIRSIKRTLGVLEQEYEEALAQLPPELDSPRGGGGLDANPVFQQLRMAQSNAEIEVSALEVRVADQRRRIEELQNLVNTIPDIESELKRLNRDYSVNQENYKALLQRREQAAMSQNIEDQGERVQFRIIEPARVPTSPSAPNRMALFTGVLVLGLGAGGGLAFVMSQLRPVFDDRRTLNRTTGFPVLGNVVLHASEQQRHRERLWLLTFIGLTVLLLLAYGATIATAGRYLKPLGQLF